MSFSTGQVLTAAQLNDLDIDTLQLGESPAVSKTPDSSWSGFLNVTMGASSPYTGGIAGDDDAIWFGHNSGSRAIYFATNETMRMNITGGSGFVYVGTTGGTAFPSTDGFLSVQSPSGTPAGAFYRPTSASTADLFYGYSDHSATGTLHFRIECDGDVDNSNNSYGSLSDERLKENIADPRDYYDDLRKLEVKNFNFCKAVKIDYEENEAGEINPETKTVSLVDTDVDSRKKLLGLIAQPTEQVMAGLVKTDEEGYKHIRYSVLVPMLLQMCQKLADKVEALENA